MDYYTFSLFKHIGISAGCEQLFMQVALHFYVNSQNEGY
jgi:hypothetical protein